MFSRLFNKNKNTPLPNNVIPFRPRGEDSDVTFDAKKFKEDVYQFCMRHIVIGDDRGISRERFNKIWSNCIPIGLFDHDAKTIGLIVMSVNSGIVQAKNGEIV